MDESIHVHGMPGTSLAAEAGGSKRISPRINDLKCQDAGFTVRHIMSDNSSSPGSAWLMFALLTVFSWGIYGVFLHKGQTLMKVPGTQNVDVSILRYKAFLFVG